MGRYILKRLVYMIFVFFLLTFILFVLYQLMPANRAYTDARTEIQTMKNLTEEEKKTKFDELYLKYQRLYGTDTDNKFILYLRWLGLYPYYSGEFKGIFEGNFGFSYDYNKPVIEVVPTHMRNSFIIGIITEIAVLGVTIPLGIKCAVKKGSRFDRFTQFFTLIGFSTPSFIIYIVFIVFFCSILHWFPVSGMQTPGNPYTGFRKVLDVLHHVALPTICLTFSSLAREKAVVYSHAWRNALVPMVAIIVGGFFNTISGAMILEQMFGFKGMGFLFLSATRTADYDMIMFLEVIYTFIGLFANLVIDLTYGLVDPRVRISK